MERRDDDKEGKAAASSSRNSKVKLILLAPHKRRRGRGGRGGGGPAPETATSTPILPWKATEEAAAGIWVVGGRAQLTKSHFFTNSPAPIPARRVAAAVWEFLQYFSPPEGMQFGGADADEGDGLRIRLNPHHHRRRRDHHQHYLHHHRDLGGGPSQRAPDPQPATASSLRRQVAALLAQHHRASERNPPAASYGSSLEINAYNQASTPTSSIECKGRIVESGQGFKTSTELLKVLNRIWALEEQHSSNISVVKAMKTELGHARARIKELLRDQQMSRHEIDELMKQVTEDQLSRKSKDHERIHATIESLRGELEDERKLRKRSEGLHRRLAREIFEVKVALSTSLKELERERTGRCLLEELCDEFAQGIMEYEREAHMLKQKTEKNRADAGICMTDSDRLMVHMCESWLDERFQMKDKQEAQGRGFLRQDLVVDNIREEIESFLQTRKMAASREEKDRRLRRNSLESLALNDAGSAPGYTGGNEDSAVSTSRLFEITQTGNKQFNPNKDEVRKDPTSTKNELSDVTTGANHQDEIQTADLDNNQEKSVTEIRKVAPPREGRGAINKLVSELLLSEGGRGIVEGDENKRREAACKDGNAATRRKATVVSPVDGTITGAASMDPKRSESTSKNTLKAKLQEPKARVGYRSRLKILKGSS